MEGVHDVGEEALQTTNLALPRAPTTPLQAASLPDLPHAHIPMSFLRDQARALGVIKRQRKYDVRVLLTVELLTFSSGAASPGLRCSRLQPFHSRLPPTAALALAAPSRSPSSARGSRISDGMGVLF